eukprot:3106233-Rhodomonas_salina.1
MQHEGLRACIMAGHALHNTHVTYRLIIAHAERLGAWPPSQPHSALRAKGIDISTPGHHNNSKGIG